MGKAKGAAFPYELSGETLTIQADKKTTSVFVKQKE
jgi:hypothetical protein